MLRQFRPVLVISLAIGATLALGGCSLIEEALDHLPVPVPTTPYPTDTPTTPPVTPPPVNPPPVVTPPVVTPPAQGAPGIDHVVIILEENKPITQIFGDVDAPYFNKLASSGATATGYSGLTHPSLPNYIALTSGGTQGVTTDCIPTAGTCAPAVPHIGTLMDTANLTWKMYGEGMPAACTLKNSGTYLVRHVPFAYYPDVTNDPARCASHVVPYTQFAADLAAGTLPKLAIVSPDRCNDMHDCPVSSGDLWLSQQVPALLASPGFSGNSLLVVTFDEGSAANNTVATVFAGPAAKPGFTTSVTYNHYSLLHTLETIWKLPTLTADDAAAPVMTQLLQGW